MPNTCTAVALASEGTELYDVKSSVTFVNFVHPLNILLNVFVVIDAVCFSDTTTSPVRDVQDSNIPLQHCVAGVNAGIVGIALRLVQPENIL